MISLSKKSRDLSFLSWCLWLFYNAYFILSQTSYLTVSEYAYIFPKSCLCIDAFFTNQPELVINVVFTYPCPKTATIKLFLQNFI